MIAAWILAGLALKSAVLAGATLGLLRLLRGRSAALRSLVAHLGLVALVALPAAAVLLPAWSVVPVPRTVPGSPATIDPSAMPSTVDLAATSTPDEAAIARVPAATEALPIAAIAALGAYLLPLALLLGTMLVAVARLFAMRGRAAVLVEPRWLAALAQAQARMGFKHGTALLVSDELGSPISWGVLRPTIVLHPNAVGAPREAEAIIAHELAHVERLDWAKLLLARLACALFWFNPLVWLLAREAHQLREESADDAVLAADIDRVDYAALLVGAARHDNAALLLAAHGVAPGRGSLKRRITRVLDGELDRRRVGAGGGLMSLVVLAGFTLPLALLAPTAGSDARAEAEIVAPATLPAVPAIQPERVPAVDEPVRAERDPARARTDAGHQVERVRVDRPTPARALIAAKAIGMDAAYAASIASAFADARIGDVVAARAIEVDAAYAARMRATFPDIDLDEVVGARAAGVSTAYAAEMRQRFPDADLHDMTALRALGVTGAYVDEMRRSGVALSRPRDAVALRAVDRPSVVRPPAARLRRDPPDPPFADH